MEDAVKFLGRGLRKSWVGEGSREKGEGRREKGEGKRKKEKGKR